MTKNKNIDNIFRDGLANYSQTPPAYVWDSIGSGLQGARRRKKALILWRSVAAAAFIALIFLGGLFWNNASQNNIIANLDSKTRANTDSDTQHALPETVNNKDIQLYDSNNAKITPSQTTIKSDIKNIKTPLSGAQKNYTHITNSTATLGNKHNRDSKATQPSSVNGKTRNDNIILLQKMEARSNVFLSSNSEIDATILLKQNHHNTLPFNTYKELPYAFNDILPNNTENDKKNLQFALGGQFSPSYSYRENSSSASAANETGIVSYTGGINLNIKTRKRWAVETGIYYAQLGQKFSNSILSKQANTFYSAAPSAGIKSKEANLQNSMGEIRIASSAQQHLIQEMATSMSNIQINSDANVYSRNEFQDITVQQELEYIEIPFLLRYDILAKSVGLSISGGMSTNFLVGNNAYKLDNSIKDRIGEMEDINSISYSAIIGLGLSAPILKSLDFNLEPRIKYFMNSVTNSTNGNYKPYSIGIYTGISYKF